MSCEMDGIHGRDSRTCKPTELRWRNDSIAGDCNGLASLSTIRICYLSGIPISDYQKQLANAGAAAAEAELMTVSGYYEQPIESRSISLRTSWNLITSVPRVACSVYCAELD